MKKKLTVKEKISAMIKAKSGRPGSGTDVKRGTDIKPAEIKGRGAKAPVSKSPVAKKSVSRTVSLGVPPKKRVKAKAKKAKPKSGLTTGGLGKGASRKPSLAAQMKPRLTKHANLLT